MEEASWWIEWNKLPTLASDDDECDAETLGERNPVMKHRMVARQTNTVIG